ncbi:MAG: ABC-F family ATP-binding cassette domain-containing protein [Acidimicrobiales bacterium]
MLTASGLSRSFGSRTLFHDVALTLDPGRRVALVGGNGVGKTTLLEIVVGLAEPDTGEVHRPKGTTVGYLPQEPETDRDGTVLEAVLAGAGEIADLAHLLGELEAAMATGADEKTIAAYGEAQSRFSQLGGYALEAEAHSVLSGLGFRPGDADRPVRQLSGGWRMRVELARLLLANPDLLVLDEPTNHLDVDSVAWLEEYLTAWGGALLFVSHDRDFIDTVAGHIIEIAGGRAATYVGGFAEFVVAREERIAQAEAAAAQQRRQVADVERFIERFRYKASKARQVQSRLKTLEKLAAVEVPTREELKARFAFPEPQRSSRVIAELEGVAVGYDDETILSGVDLHIERGEKLAFVGPNGAGKSTLVKLLTGELEASGGSIQHGANVDTAVFHQQQAEVLDLSRTVYEEFKTSIGRALDGKNLRTLLGSFGFSGDAGDRLVGDLSGGERTRLALAKIMALPVNLLVLDEPTNHLDLPSCDLLEDALSAYPGTVVLVTHDRHLIRNVADALVVIRDGRATRHEGVDETLLHPPSPSSGRSAPTKPQAKAKPGSGAPSPQRTAPNKREQAEARNARHRATEPVRRRLQKLEREWESAEASVVELQGQLADPAVYEDADRLRDLTTRHDEARDRAADLMSRWEDAAAELARVEAEHA